MKKLLLITLACCLFLSYAVADGIDLSSMSFDELVSFRNAITAELMARPEWKRVQVPVGRWIIGEDIPAGYYSISAPSDLAIVKSTPDGSSSHDFYHVLAKGEKVGKELFLEGSVFENDAVITLSPPVSLGF